MKMICRSIIRVCMLAVCFAIVFPSVNGKTGNKSAFVGDAYIRLVNNTKTYPTVSLYVDGNGCGSATQGDYTVCTVSPGTHKLTAVGVNTSGGSDSKSRTETVADGQTYTWTITD